MIIGLCGDVGAGKDAVGEILEARGFLVVHFADPIYMAVSVITGIPLEELLDRKKKDQIIPWLGKSPRQLFQTLGHEWGRVLVNDLLWVMRGMQRALEVKDAAIPGVRYDNEAVAIRQAGGVVMEVVREGAGLTGDTAKHSSEKGVSRHLIHGTIDNNGTLLDLEGEVNALLCRLRRRRTPAVSAVL